MKFHGGMKIILVALFICSTVPGFAAQSSFPEPMGYINDFASVIDPGVRDRMESYAAQLVQKTGVEIAVVTIRTTGDVDYNEYANRLYEAWGIGQKNSDEGVLIFNAVEDRTIRVEIGYGLEGLIPDARAGEIRDLMIPYLKQGNYGEGLFRGFAAVAGIIARDRGIELTGEAPVQTTQNRHNTIKKGMSGFLSFFIFIIFILLMGRSRRRAGLLPLIFLSGMGHRSSGGFGSGFSGGFGGGFSGFGGGMSGGGGAGGSY